MRRTQNPWGVSDTLILTGGVVALGAAALYVWQSKTAVASTTPAATSATTALGLPAPGASQTVGAYTVTTSADGMQVTISDTSGHTVTAPVSGLTGNLQQGTLNAVNATGQAVSQAGISMSSLDQAFAGSVNPTAPVTPSSPPNSQLLSQAGLPAAGQSKSYAGPGGSSSISVSADGSSVTFTAGGTSVTVSTSSLSGSLTGRNLATSDSSAGSTFNAAVQAAYSTGN